jgi:hypothetical protein
MAQHIRAVPKHHHSHHPRWHLLLSCKSLQHQDGWALQAVSLQLREAGREGAEGAGDVRGQAAHDGPGANASQAAQAAAKRSGNSDNEGVRASSSVDSRRAASCSVLQVLMFAKRAPRCWRLTEMMK